MSAAVRYVQNHGFLDATDGATWDLLDEAEADWESLINSVPPEDTDPPAYGPDDESGWRRF